MLISHIRWSKLHLLSHMYAKTWEMPLKMTKILMSNFYLVYFYSKKCWKLSRSHYILRSNPSNIANHHLWHLAVFADFTVRLGLWKTPKTKEFSRSYAFWSTDHQLTYFFFGLNSTSNFYLSIQFYCQMMLPRSLKIALS